MESVVVFGGSGFLGSHIADELSNRGFKIYIFDRVISPFKSENQEMIIGDILDRDAVRDVIKKVDYVYHFAAIADIGESREKPVETAQFNIIGTMNILDACREFNIKRFVYSSTIYVYSDHGSFYRSSKQACELFIENYQKEFSLPFTILRYGSLYGPRANHFNFIKNAIIEALTTKEINRKGDGKEIRDYINVLDAACSSVDILENNYKNSYVMITGPQTMCVSELLNMIREILNNEIEINYLDEDFAGHYQITPYSFKPKVALKVTPKNYHDLGQGILECVYDIYDELKKRGNEDLLTPGLPE
jgi:UDP-glucose 4-epimerase